MQPEQNPSPWAQPTHPDQPGHGGPGFPAAGFPPPDHSTPHGEAAAGHAPPGHAQPGYGYAPPGYPPPGYPPPGYPPAAGQPGYPPVAGQPGYPPVAGGPPGLTPPPGWTADQPPPWLVPNVPAVAPRPVRRGPRKALIIAGVAVVALLGAGAAGANAYARNTICSSLEGDSALTGGSSAEPAEPGPAELTRMREAADELRGYGRMLVFDGDLKTAVNGLADDVDQLADLAGSDGTTAAGGFAELMTIAGSVNSHARQAQRACDLPVKGIFAD